MTCDTILYAPKIRLEAQITFHAEALSELNNMLNRTDRDLMPLVNLSTNSIVRLTLLKAQETLRVKAQKLGYLFEFMTKDIE